LREIAAWVASRANQIQTDPDGSADSESLALSTASARTEAVREAYQAERARAAEKVHVSEADEEHASEEEAEEPSADASDAGAARSAHSIQRSIEGQHNRADDEVNRTHWRLTEVSSILKIARNLAYAYPRFSGHQHGLRSRWQDRDASRREVYHGDLHELIADAREHLRQAQEHLNAAENHWGPSHRTRQRD